MLQELRIKIKQWARREDLFLTFLIVTVGFGSFAFGRLSALNDLREPITITTKNNIVYPTYPTYNDKTRIFTAQTQSVSRSSISKEDVSGIIDGGVVGSKTGSKYHFPWCSGAVRIREDNKIFFASVEAARKAGYTPAGNCKGLK